ncbi:DUF748 domain-containing protein [Thiopseudomonas alkaliphila]|uniref:DUF748 domain-containing protein n=1 Tax=Thiopseudomonas alkaliphila TaxID=1697053 RepID=UPI00069E5DDD|nr:DUF748 domain-containing protein [Thiopseudomonas alkaliphila]AKX51004.1 hypothetical protein AKN92_05425 [Thiopseudomonas alkaliphila]AKX57361.1 hypothetical protein AKN89_05605 [Thiopseudomonas alkaliphila]
MSRTVKISLGLLFSLLLLVIAIEWLLPLWLLHYLNQKLDNLEQYRGHIEHIDLQLWRGAYRIDQLSIVKKNAKIPVPLFAAKQIFISISWPALWNRHSVVATVSFEQPEVNFVDGGRTGASQTGQGVDWRQQLRQLVPIKLNEVQIHDGQLAFYNFTTQPKVHLYADQVQGSISNLTNIEDAQGQRVAHFTGHGQLFNAAKIEASASFDPLTDWQNFAIKAKTTDVALKHFNEFTQAYAKFDFAKGTGDVVLDVEAKDSQLSGYIKPLLHNVEVFNYQQDIKNPDKNIFQGLWEALVGTGETALKNQAKNQFATKVELKGTTQHAKLSPLQAFLSVLKNGFVKAFTPTYESAQ